MRRLADFLTACLAACSACCAACAPAPPAAPLWAASTICCAAAAAGRSKACAAIFLHLSCVWVKLYSVEKTRKCMMTM